MDGGSGDRLLVGSDGACSGSVRCVYCDWYEPVGIACAGDLRGRYHPFPIRPSAPLTKLPQIPRYRSLAEVMLPPMKSCGWTRCPGYLQPTIFVQGMVPCFVWTMLVCPAVLICRSLVTWLAPFCGVRLWMVGSVTRVVLWPILPRLLTLVLVPCTARMKCPRLMITSVPLVTIRLRMACG